MMKESRESLHIGIPDIGIPAEGEAGTSRAAADQTGAAKFGLVQNAGPAVRNLPPDEPDPVSSAETGSGLADESEAEFLEEAKIPPAAGLPTEPGIYIHIPFCVQKCIYCDFNSLPGCTAELKGRYFRSLIREIEAFKDELALRAEKGLLDRTWFADTLFLGGGTPSAAGPALIEELMEHIRRPGKSGIRLLKDGDDGLRAGRGHRSFFGEITMEVNPGTVTEDDLCRYRRAGINRLSIGVQSFQDEELKFLGRIHTAREAEECISAARRAGFENLNIDLIFGFPGNTRDKWKETLLRALDLKPDHISFYSLQIEEGTPLYQMFRRDEVEQVRDEENRAMYRDAAGLLKESGYLRYEISNASLPGRACRHNLKYWSMCDYVGFGVSAHSYLDRARSFNEDDIGAYLQRMEALQEEFQQKIGGGSVHSGCPDWGAKHGVDSSAGVGVDSGVRSGYRRRNLSQNTLEDELEETLFTGLRKTEGIDIRWFDMRFAPYGTSFEKEYGEKIRPYVESGDLILEDGKIRFSERGLDISNYILARLI